jgi:hypothetical protein
MWSFTSWGCGARNGSSPRRAPPEVSAGVDCLTMKFQNIYFSNLVLIFFRTVSVFLENRFLRPLGRCRRKRFSNSKSDFPSIVIVITPILFMDHRWSLSLITGCVLFAYHTHTARPVNFTPKLTPIHPHWLAPVVVVVIDKYIGLVSSGSITTPTSSFIKTKCLPRTAYISFSKKRGGGPCPLIVETHAGPCVCVCVIYVPRGMCVC